MFPHTISKPWQSMPLHTYIQTNGVKHYVNFCSKNNPILTSPFKKQKTKETLH